MQQLYTFLVVDLNPEGTALLSRTLGRRFPGAVIITCAEAEDSVEKAQTQKLDAIVVHRPLEITGEEMVRQLREKQPDIPIIMVSSADKTESARKSGANGFLLYDAWLLLGGVVSWSRAGTMNSSVMSSAAIAAFRSMASNPINSTDNIRKLGLMDSCFMANVKDEPRPARARLVPQNDFRPAASFRFFPR